MRPQPEAKKKKATKAEAKSSPPTSSPSVRREFGLPFVPIKFRLPTALDFRRARRVNGSADESARRSSSSSGSQSSRAKKKVSKKRGQRPAATPLPTRRARRWRGFQRVVWPALITIAFLAVLVVGYFPTRQYLQQRSEISDREAELIEVEAQNSDLESQLSDLQDPEQIELLARAELGLVFPGEESYAIMVPPDDPVDVPSVWPFNRLEDRLEG